MSAPRRACRNACIGAAALTPQTYASQVSQARETPATASVRRGLAAWLAALVAFAAGSAATCGMLALTHTHERDDGSKTALRHTAAVITAVRDLAVLETATYHVERVIDLRDTQSQLFGLSESEDALLLVAAADVVAGVDLGLMQDGDVRVDQAQRSAFIQLPEPSVLWARLDNDSTYVHSRKTDMLALRARTLETRARQLAEHALRDAALQSGILSRARQNAARTIQVLVQSLGYEHVQVAFGDELPLTATGGDSPPSRDPRRTRPSPGSAP